MEKEELFKDITTQLYDILIKKNHDYGSSVSQTYRDFGLTSYAIRISDKLNRLKTLIKEEKLLVTDESIQDTLMDLAGYSVLALVELKLEGKDNG